MIVAFHTLNEDMLVRILSEPRNAYVPQYQKLFQMDKVNLIYCRLVNTICMSRNWNV